MRGRTAPGPHQRGEAERLIRATLRLYDAFEGAPAGIRPRGDEGAMTMLRAGGGR